MSERELEWWLTAVCSEEHFAAALDDPASVVLIDDRHRAVGTVSFAEAAYVSGVYVACAGAGAGGRMVEALLDRARSAGQRTAELA